MLRIDRRAHQGSVLRQRQPLHLCFLYAVSYRRFVPIRLSFANQSVQLLPLNCTPDLAVERADHSCCVYEVIRFQILVRIPMTYKPSLGLHLTSLQQTKGHFLKLDKPSFLHIFFQLTLHCFPRCNAWAFNISRVAGLDAPCTLGCIYEHYKFNTTGNVRIL